MKFLASLAFVLCFVLSAFAEEPADTLENETDLYYLVPELEQGSTFINDGRRQYKRHVSMSPAVGKLGENDLFAVRLAFNPDHWMGYEISFGHNPASSLHALIHTLNLQLRYPLPGRFQPYLSVGYGMMTVYPGEALNADPVTKNILAFGGGVEAYLRDDVALRAEARSAVVLGQTRGNEETVAYTYPEYTLGMVFYRALGE